MTQHNLRIRRSADRHDNSGGASPSGSGDGAERIVTPAGKFKVRWPGSWNTGRSMYRWMARSALHVTAVQLMRADVDSPWVWHIEFTRTEP